MSEEPTAPIMEKISQIQKALDRLAEQLTGEGFLGKDWRRMPKPPKRCEISGWSRRTIDRLVVAGEVRVRRTANSTFYSGADMRAYLDANTKAKSQADADTVTP